jgi:hypothetical protein
MERPNVYGSACRKISSKEIRKKRILRLYWDENLELQRLGMIYYRVGLT